MNIACVIHVFVCPISITAQMLREERKSYNQSPSPGRERIHGLVDGFGRESYTQSPSPGRERIHGLVDGFDRHVCQGHTSQSYVEGQNPAFP